MRRLIADQTHSISLKLNGKPVCRGGARMLLSDFIRHVLGAKRAPMLAVNTASAELVRFAWTTVSPVAA